MRTAELATLLQVSKPTIWRWEKEGNLPPRKKFGPNVSGWIRSSIQAWLASRPDAAPKVDQEV